MIKGGYSSEFLVAWSLYPSRGWHPNPKKLAYNAWRGRLTQGVSVEDLTHATQEYAHYCRRTKKIGTETTMMARTFYGPNERWKDFVPQPKGGDASAVPRTVSDSEMRRPVGRPSDENQIAAVNFIRGLITDLAQKKSLPDTKK